MTNVMAWMTIALVLATGPALLLFSMIHTFSRRPVEAKYEHAAGGGLVGAFDSVWSPSAHEAGQERDRQQRASVPAPTPDKGPGVMDKGHITIEI